MSLESSIATLTQQAGLLMDLPQQVADVAQAQIAAIGAAYQTHLATLSTTFYVDQVNGLDTQAGTVNAPLKSLGKALALTPRGGICVALLKSDYTLADVTLVDGRLLAIVSDSVVKRNIYFSRLLDATTTPNNRYPACFKMSNDARIAFVGVTLNMPVLDGSWTAITLSGTYRGLISPGGYFGYEEFGVAVSLCDVNIPTTPFCPLIMNSSGVHVHWFSNTLTGDVTSINGRLFEGQTNTAGVASNTLSWLQTGLATV